MPREMRKFLQVASPIVKPFKVGVGFAEKFAFHLFKLAETEEEVTGVISFLKLLPTWQTPKGVFSGGTLDVGKVDKMP